MFRPKISRITSFRHWIFYDKDVTSDNLVSVKVQWRCCRCGTPSSVSLYRLPSEVVSQAASLSVLKVCQSERTPPSNKECILPQTFSFCSGVHRKQPNILLYKIRKCTRLTRKTLCSLQIKFPCAYAPY